MANNRYRHTLTRTGSLPFHLRSVRQRIPQKQKFEQTLQNSSLDKLYDVAMHGKIF